MPQDAAKNRFATSAAITSLTDSSGGTASGTVAAISDPPTQAEVRDALASVIAKQNAILAALRDAGIIVS